MKVKPNTLLLMACLVWAAAGANILRIGVLAYPGHATVGNLFLLENWSSNTPNGSATMGRNLSFF